MEIDFNKMHRLHAVFEMPNSKPIEEFLWIAEHHNMLIFVSIFLIDLSLTMSAIAVPDNMTCPMYLCDPTELINLEQEKLHSEAMTNMPMLSESFCHLILLHQNRNGRVLTKSINAFSRAGITSIGLDNDSNHMIFERSKLCAIHIWSFIGTNRPLSDVTFFRNKVWFTKRNSFNF